MTSAVCGIKADYPHSTVTESLAGWGLVLAGAALMLVATLGTPQRFLPAPLVYLGRISYGLYLTHIFFFWLVYDKFKPWLAGLGDDAGMLLAFAATVAVASVLYRTFETPFLRLKRRFTRVPSRD